jgi:diguanylate cyclase (GGDEF)-like protein
MLERQTSNQGTNKEFLAGESTRTRTLALFTESIVALLSSKSCHHAFVDLVSLMGQTFPLAAPALYIESKEFRHRVYTMLEQSSGGDNEANKILGDNNFIYERVLVGGHPPIVRLRKDFFVMNTPRVKIILCINSGIHDEIFREWVKILTPAVAKLMDHELLMHMAYQDGLTGLLNYRAFDEMLKAELDRASRYDTIFSIMMIDIDYFKRVNDGYGHPVGDVVLKTLADNLKCCVRKSDRVFRYGGEEFAIILPHTGLKKAKKLANRIRLMVDKTSFIGGLHITVSIGIGQYSDGHTPGDLVKQVDKGLYRAKKKGRNKVETSEDIS